MEEEINRYKTIIGAYYGVMLMDEYPLKAYVLKNIENLAANYLQDKNIKADDIKSFIRDKVSLLIICFVLDVSGQCKEI